MIKNENFKNEDFVCVIQARMSSTRLPGKVLKKINTKEGVCILGFLVKRLEALLNIGVDIIVATSSNTEDDLIEDYINSNHNNISVFRGDLDDVLSRYYNCVKALEKKAIIRITSDCPFTDPDLIIEMMEVFKNSKLDFLGNTVPPEKSEFSDGFDVEIFSFQILEECMNNSNLTKSEKEHVTFAMWKNSKYKSQLFPNKHKNQYSFKLSIDDDKDFELFENLVKEIKVNARYYEIETLVSNRKLYLINKESIKNSGWLK